MKRSWVMPDLPYDNNTTFYHPVYIPALGKQRKHQAQHNM